MYYSLINKPDNEVLGTYKLDLNDAHLGELGIALIYFLQNFGFYALWYEVKIVPAIEEEKE